MLKLCGRQLQDASTAGICADLQGLRDRGAHPDCGSCLPAMRPVAMAQIPAIYTLRMTVAH
ncbi:hypothetical protein DBR24_08590 [Pseudomonas sp. HMWF006]|nr:hypothetical protein DBR24_08590 [Pseudomonas sp. HMWF006]PTT65782.1 hypothetical protein DBR26_18840 [Pseudomonas sp. HMWF007]